MHQHSPLELAVSWNKCSTYFLLTDKATKYSLCFNMLQIVIWAVKRLYKIGAVKASLIARLRPVGFF